jgi:hypothetical protein
MSQTCADPLPIYIRHEGQGNTIYVIDAGFRRSHVDLAANGRSIREHVVPNALTLGHTNVPEDRWHPQDITDISVVGHGTGVASVAGGVNQGVAPRADLVLVKFRNAVRNATGDNFIAQGTTDPALEAAWDFVISDVRAGNHTGRPIVVMSYGYDARFGNKDAIMRRALQECHDLDIVTITAAGNAGLNGDKLHENTPQNFGSPTNGLITVGGVREDGKLWPSTTPQEPGEAGQCGTVESTCVNQDEY